MLKTSDLFRYSFGIRIRPNSWPSLKVLRIPRGVQPCLYRCSEEWNSDYLGMFGGLGRLGYSDPLGMPRIHNIYHIFFDFVCHCDSLCKFVVKFGAVLVSKQLSLWCSADQMLIFWSVVYFEQVGSSRSCVLAK